MVWSSGFRVVVLGQPSVARLRGDSAVDLVSNIDLKQLNMFMELVRNGNFGTAAARLGIGQPNLSRKIRQLETELGGALLTRHSKGAVLTKKGAALYGITGDYLKSLQDLAVSNNAEIKQSRIVLGMPWTSSSMLIPSIFSVVKDIDPSLDISFFEGSSLELEQAIESGHVAAALLYDPPNTPATKSTPIIEEEMLVIAPPSWDWSETPALTLKDLTALPLVLLGPDHADRRKLAEVEKHQGIRLDAVLEVDSPSTLKALVNRGTGFSVMSALSIDRELAMGSLQARPFGLPTQKTRLHITRPAGELSPVLGSIIEGVSETVFNCTKSNSRVRTISRRGFGLA
jgi:LysR family nitrogen assimilation transcriptional regulator